ncbi:histone H3-like centromeric protein A [Ammospiza caudacuta]|uniref:histone H3-like centromeric protein A n=1 Tax=Ammospiza caudacuta TaxID=2857398 RepID=UPI0027389883|nr:histone H3-like centromeric protein A [Ammospiza caudacuta]
MGGAGPGWGPAGLWVTLGLAWNAAVTLAAEEPAEEGITLIVGSAAGCSEGPAGCCPGQQALQEICKYQSSTCLLLRPSLFARLVWELCLLFTLGVDYRWQSMALLALQEAAEAFMVRLLEDACLCSLHAHQVTLIPQDLQLAQRLRGPKVGGI